MKGEDIREVDGGRNHFGIRT
ncbi:protein of unknown function [Burkholderia multivorans]